ncbi:MAG: NAD(P)-dependent alcohol dehydrogenase [Acidimicrobiales bacterium]
MAHDVYGTADVLELRDLPDPTPGPGEVVVGIEAASLNAADWHFLTGTPLFARIAFGLRRPRRTVPGVDLTGTVMALGPDVVDLAVGDAVVGWREGGALAELAVVPSDQLVRRPDSVTIQHAATLGVAAFTALQGLRDVGALVAGEKVLVKGASGGVGTFAVQIAAVLGADVTAVCSTPNVETVRSLGANRVIDYRNDHVFDGERYDLLLDIAGPETYADCRAALTDAGRHVLVGGPKGRILGPIPYFVAAKLRSIPASQSFTTFVSSENRADLQTLVDWVAEGAITPVIDRTFPLVDAADAMRYQGEGHSRGKIVVTMS